MAEYLEKVVRATGGHAAPAENLDSDKKEAPEGYHYMPDGTLMRDDEHDNEAASENPCWEGYVQVGMKTKDGKEVPNCVPAAEAAMQATAGSKPAEANEKIKGSKKNKKGSAAGGKKIKFSKKVTESLKKKVAEHNEKHGDAKSKKTSLRTLKAVYRRGAGAFSTSHRPDQNRNSWAMARVNAFLYLLRNGKPKNSKYVTDNDLLPSAHSRSSKKSGAMTASAFDLYIESQLEAYVYDYAEFSSDEDAVISLAEYSDYGYDALPAIKAIWNRAVELEEDPYSRALEFAINPAESKDSDLIPKVDVE